MWSCRMMNTLTDSLIFRKIAYSLAINFGLSKTEYTAILGIILIRKKRRNMRLPVSDIIQTNFVTLQFCCA